MRKLIALSLVAAAAPALFAEGNSRSQATTTASVTIFAPVKLLAIWGADFGKIMLDDMSQPASIELTPSKSKGIPGVGTYANAVNCSPKTAGNSFTAAHFDLFQDNSLAVCINLGPKVDLGSGVMFTPAMGEWDLEYPGIYKAYKGATWWHFDVGGKLEIPAGVVGKFTKEFTVTANYN